LRFADRDDIPAEVDRLIDERGGRELLLPEIDAKAVQITPTIFKSTGSTAAYVVTGAGERLIVNTGKGVEAHHHKTLFDAVAPMPTRFAAASIRVNAVAPGVTVTNMTAGIVASPERTRAQLSRVPLGRLGVPADIAPAVLFLCGAQAGYITRPVEYAAIGQDFSRRGELMDHVLDTVLKAWTGEPFEYDDATIRVTPVPLTRPHPRLVVGGAAGRRGVEEPAPADRRRHAPGGGSRREWHGGCARAGVNGSAETVHGRENQQPALCEA
jgi:hypothetical protein